MALHSLFVPESSLTRAGDGSPYSVAVAGDQAHHAVRVLRLVKGDQVQLLDGQGAVAQATITLTQKDREAGWVLTAEVTSLSVAPKPSPAVHVFAACPKGDRLGEMIEGVSQAGATSFTPLVSELSIVDPREGKVDRLRRISAESLKQCRRLWGMDVFDPMGLDGALADAAAKGRRVLIADGSGVPLRELQPVPSGDVALFVGPEGGWSERELAQFRQRADIIVRFGPHVMRIETAAIVGTAMLLEHVSGA
jgi:16S rRNA (uracil1498-N3)-methyltransferase